ncbi:Maf family protein [Phosphitispora sp. TUW77]|uniref:Maf family protein n=1 Tax=Phosphitispora sp. TUW77 TaxID=3152361 RepID=UPI003AB48BA4
MKKLILASGSPRRQELLKQMGLCFEVMVNPVDETVLPGMPPTEAVAELAYRKAMAVAARLNEGIVIGADTVVVHCGDILGKPSGIADAINTLKSLSGTDHLVITGFSIVDCATGRLSKASETTRVFFRRLSDVQIEAYVRTGEPMDKAGSYGIQGLGAVLVKKIEGCYFNVVGLPLSSLAAQLRQFGVEMLK